MLRPFPENPHYRAEIRAILQLHRLWLKGKGESPEADALRDATDGPWELLSDGERKRLRGLSEDLNAIGEQVCNDSVEPMNPEAQAKLVEASEARQNGEWDLALDTLRLSGKSIAPAVLSYLRGAIWSEAGDPETGAVFFRHATRLDPNLGAYRALSNNNVNARNWFQDLIPAPLKAKMAQDESDLFLLLLNAIQPRRCTDVRRYFHGRRFPGRDLVAIEGIYDLFGRFEFLIKLRVPGDNVEPIHKILQDLRRRRWISPRKDTDAILLNVTHEYYPKPPGEWHRLSKEQQGLKAFLHVYPWDGSKRTDFLETCNRAAELGISTVGVFIASKGRHSELVAEYYSGCGSYYDQVAHILEVEKSLRGGANHNALLVMNAVDEKRPPRKKAPALPRRRVKIKGST